MIEKGFDLNTIQKAANEILDTDLSDWFPQPAKFIQNCNDLKPYEPDQPKMEQIPYFDQSLEERQEVGRMMGDLVKSLKASA